MSERSRRAADRIRQAVPILGVLADYGYDIDPRGGDVEQQFRCDLHGDGNDGKPSARAYPETHQFYCFACGRSRDVISLVQEKEGKKFWEAVALLERKAGLPSLPWEETEKEASVTSQVREALASNESPERVISRLDSFLEGVTRDRALPAKKCAALWEARDRVWAYHTSEGSDPFKTVTSALKILQATKQALGIPEM